MKLEIFLTGVVVPILCIVLPEAIHRRRPCGIACAGCGLVAPALPEATLARLGWVAFETFTILCPACRPADAPEPPHALKP